MIKTNKKIAIEKDIFANDLLGREETITDLSKLIENQKESLALSVNADWGAGKTTFVRLWQAYLKKQKIESIYFSAWENDFSNEPLVAILGELNAYISKSKNDKLKGNFEKTKKIASKIVPTLIKSAANIATAGMAGDAVEVLIDDYKTNKNDLQKLKDSIAEILKTINEDKPFIIFIDELDRCKPLYAIEFLERIKHIFDIERLIFVLSIDKNNLAKSIQSQYGNIDTDNYLRRFINLEYPLKNPNVNNFCAALFQQFELVNILNSKTIQRNWNSDLNLIQQLSIIFNLSLRQIEQIFTKLHIFFSTIPLRFYSTHFSIFILFECLKSYDRQRYDDFLAGNIPATEIEDMTLNGLTQNLQHAKIFIRAIIATIPLRNDPEEIRNFINKQTDDDFRLALMSSENAGSYTLANAINTAIKYIDLADTFDFSINKQN